MGRNHNYYVYILTNQNNRVLYIGITNDIERRVIEHRMGLGSKFTRKYKLKKLVYVEHFTQVSDAIAFETRIKGWRRSRKLALIEAQNPKWKELYSVG